MYSSKYNGIIISLILLVILILLTFQNSFASQTGLKTVAGCVDTSCNGSLAIAEVQKVINGFLGS